MPPGQTGREGDGESEPREVADATIQDVCDRLGIDRAEWIRDVDYEALGDSTYAFYDPNNRSMTINEALLAPERRADLAEAVAHETFHAYQNQEVDKLERGLTDHDSRAQEWKDNWALGNYKDPDEPGVTYSEYRNQPLERDAWQFEQDYARERGQE